MTTAAIYDSRPQRWLRFSVRGLLLLVFLIAVTLTWTIDRVRQQGIAVVALKKTGCEIFFAISRPPTAMESLRGLLGEAYPQDASQLYGEPSHITDADLVHLRSLTCLKHLNLIQTQVSDVGLVHLEGLIQLDYLDLSRTRVTDNGLACLRGLSQLKTLGLLDTEVTDAGLVHLEGLTQLRNLNLMNARVTAAGVGRLQKALPKCRIAWP